MIPQRSAKGQKSKMVVIGARWTPQINVIYIKCACGLIFEIWANNSGVVCPKCGAMGLWHGCNQTGEANGPNSVWEMYPVMEIRLDMPWDGKVA